MAFCFCANMYLFSVVVKYELFSRSYRIMRIRSICYWAVVTKYIRQTIDALYNLMHIHDIVHVQLHNACTMYM